MRVPRPSRLLLTGAVALAGVAASVAVAGPARAVTGLTIVTATSVETGSEGFKSANAVCPPNTVIFGGGADITGGGHSVRLTSMLPAPLGLPTHSYFATAMESGVYNANWTLRTWAICGSGVFGWEIVTGSVAASPGSTIVSVSAVCPSGKKVIGAGAAATGGASFQLDTMEPAADLSNVYVEVVADETMPAGAAWGAKAFAVCVNPVSRQQRVSATTANDSNGKSISVSCPAGTQLHGTAASLTGAIGQAYLDRVAPIGPGSLGGTNLEAREDATGFAGNWTATVYAICAG
jgi:hypothetical protein